MSWLSPVSWAKWTWTAVRGGEEDGDEEELEAGEQRGERRGGEEEGEEEEEEEEERSQGCSSDSDGHFDTPEEATPVHGPKTFPGELEDSSADPDKTDVDREEHLIVTAPAGDQDLLLSSSMGQDEPVAPAGGSLTVDIQTLEEEPKENLPDESGLVPAASSASETLEMDTSAEQFPEQPQAIVSVPQADPILHVSPAPRPLTPEEALVQSGEPASSPAPELPEQEAEAQCNDLNPTATFEKTKSSKSKPPPLKVDASASLHEQTKGEEEEEQELPVPMGAYKFDPDLMDDSFNPFNCGGSKIPNSPPPCDSSSAPRLEPLGGPLPEPEVSSAAPAEAETTEPPSNAKPVLLEFGVDEGTVSRPPPRKLGGKKTIKKTAANKQKPKSSEASVKPAPEATEPEADSQPAAEAPEPEADSQLAAEAPFSAADTSAPLNLDDIPIPKAGSYNFDPSQWDDPTFNPFGSNSGMSNSPPLLPKGSYSFDPDSFNDSVDPFKTSKILSTEETTSAGGAPQAETKVTDGGQQKAAAPAGEKRVRQIARKNKERTVKNPCKAQKCEESQPLVLDGDNQTQDEVIVQTPEITQQVHYATDEEKLASTGLIGQTGDSQDEDVEPKGNLTAPGKKQPIKGTSDMKGPDTKASELEDTYVKDDISDISVNHMAKMGSSEAPDLAALSLDNMSMSEMDKAAMLTMIREEIITKEIEVNEWKRKYEECRVEVTEMRKIVAEYERTVAQMIEDEQQQKTFSCSKSVRQLSAERDQAIADLNSVERSFADLFRRYENMKGVLEGFKKNEEVLKKCAQDYLMRIKQEEQRYQTLKVHAEEKLDKANEEIAQVRAKSNSESVALSASLRKEQMRVDSLERAVLQKNQEIEELTKICDELIAKLGTE
ncbi:transforming acidic coiled-coil-containing protein 1 isoform X3 [Nelusetta ayraudi]|uniref:transforming acidic coiled-coil-containing protein 1 isoform X3 n=1 Tax=Nelusetta ayraudi TaxID=303726 RepID=UPI003F70F32E